MSLSAPLPSVSSNRLRMSLIPLPPVSATEGAEAAGAVALGLESSSIRGFGASGGVPAPNVADSIMGANRERS